MTEELEFHIPRMSAKRWKLLTGGADVVEVAALEQMGSLGWRGYFTERFNFWELCVLVSGMPFSRTRKGIVRSIKNCRDVFFYGAKGLLFMGSDGYIQVHERSYTEVCEAIANVSKCEFEYNFDCLCDTKIKSQYIGVIDGKPAHASQLDKNLLLSFFELVGSAGLVSYIHENYPMKKLSAMVRLKGYDDEFYDLMYGFRGPTQRLLDVAPEAVKNGCGYEFLFQPAFHFAGGFQDNIEKCFAFSEYIRDQEVAAKVKAACSYSQDCRNKLIEERRRTRLDLQLWNEVELGIAEVKAPNDRLSPRQLETLRHSTEKGERNFLIYVYD